MSGVSEGELGGTECEARLHELDIALNELATSTEAGYFDRALQNFVGEGILHLVGQHEIIEFAKGIARDELGEWAEAVERFETAKKNAREYFSIRPGLAWVLVGDKSGKVANMGLNLSSLTDDRHDYLETIFGEKLHAFTPPLDTSPELSTPTPTAFQLNMDVVPPYDKPTI